MSSSEDAAKVASTLIDSMKSQPVTLAVLVFNLAFMAMISYWSHDANQRWERLTSLLIDCPQGRPR